MIQAAGSLPLDDGARKLQLGHRWTKPRQPKSHVLQRFGHGSCHVTFQGEGPNLKDNFEDRPY